MRFTSAKESCIMCEIFFQVDPSGPIATLKKLLLSEENIASFKKWAFDNWYYCGFILCSFILLMVSICFHFYDTIEVFDCGNKIYKMLLMHSVIEI